MPARIAVKLRKLVRVRFVHTRRRATFFGPLFCHHVFGSHHQAELGVLGAVGGKLLSLGLELVGLEDGCVFLIGVVTVEPYSHRGDSFLRQLNEVLAFDGGKIDRLPMTRTRTNGTGGKEGIRGTVASTGFGNGTAVPPPSGGGKKGTVASAGFAATDTSTETPKKKVGASGPADAPPDILDKPRPEYTAEGKSLKIEGDVRVDVIFLANGTVQVNRVVSGLGHGLDESAVHAAQQIKFKPAKRQGEPVDFPAVIRIEFRLAY